MQARLHFNKRKRGSSMNVNIMNRMFRQVDSVVWDLMSGSIGLKTPSGICSISYSAKNEDNTELIDPQVSINMFEEFGVAVPAFAHAVPAESISLGDMIYSSSQSRVLGWVVECKPKSMELMKPDGTRSRWVPPRVQMIGFDSGVMVLRSLVNMLPGGNQQLGSMQGMLLPMISMGMLDTDGDSEFSLEKLMPLMLMGQMQPSTDPLQANASMQMMMQMMLMSKMLGKGSSNPLTSSPRQQTASKPSGPNWFNS